MIGRVGTRRVYGVVVVIVAWVQCLGGSVNYDVQVAWWVVDAGGIAAWEVW